MTPIPLHIYTHTHTYTWGTGNGEMRASDPEKRVREPRGAGGERERELTVRAGPAKRERERERERGRGESRRAPAIREWLLSTELIKTIPFNETLYGPFARRARLLSLYLIFLPPSRFFGIVCRAHSFSESRFVSLCLELSLSPRSL